MSPPPRTRVVTGVVLGCILGLAPRPVPALNPERRPVDYVMRSWGAAEGLPQQTVNAILQTRDGYLWIGTQDGLFRFDGVRFVPFDGDHVPELASDWVNVLLQDRHDRLWVGTYGGGLSVRDHGTWHHLGPPEGLPGRNVQALAEDDNRVWVGTENGLAVCDVHGCTDPGVALPTRDVTALLSAPGELWAGTRGGGLVRLRGRKLRVFTRQDGLPDQVVLSLDRDRSGRLWIGTYDGGVAVLEEDRIRPVAHMSSLHSRRITSLLEDRDGNIWIGTYGGGVVRVNDHGMDRLSMENGLPSHTVLSLCEDREGNLWLGLVTGGLIQLRNGPIIPVGRRHGLRDPLVFAVLEAEDGSLYLGTTSWGLVHWDEGVAGVWNRSTGFATDHIGGLGRCRYGGLWVGARTGLFHLDPQTGRWRRIELPGNLRRSFVWAVHEDRNGDLWVGTDGVGLLHRDRRGRWENVTETRHLAGGVVRAILGDLDSGLLVGTDAGLYVLQHGTQQAWTVREGLPNDVVLTLLRDTHDRVWIATLEGVAVLDGGTLRALGPEAGVPRGTVVSILPGNDGDVWLGTNKGLYRIDGPDLEAWLRGEAAQLTLQRFTRADGMPATECNGGSQPPACRRRDGSLWFPTTDGIAVVPPGELVRNTIPPPVLVEEVMADGAPLDGGPDYQVPAGTHRLEIRYTGLSLVDPDRVRFRYRFVGLDRRPVDAGTARSVVFAGLRPGTYRFEITACNQDGVWNPSWATVTLHVHGYPWQHPLFPLALALLALGVGLVLYRRRMSAARRQHARLQLMVDERTRELAHANRQLQRLAGVDPLTQLANRRTFDGELERIWRTSRRSGSTVGLVMLDIDFFKPYNDTLGHQAGDECLRRVAMALASALPRSADLVARYGGEEFVVLLPATTAEGALRVARRLVEAVRDLAIPHPASPVAPVVTVSAGAAALHPTEDDPAVLIALADEALYAAKAKGRDRAEGSTRRS